MNGRPRQHRHARSRGFTLLETLLAVLVFSLVAAAAYGTLDSMSRAVQAGSNASERLRSVQTAVQRFENELRPALAVGMQAGLGVTSGRVALTGDGQAIEFHYLAPALGPEGPRLAGVRYELRNNQWHRLPATGPALAGTRLLDGVERLNLAYLDQAGRWQSDWRGRSPVDLPAAVRLDLQLSGFGRVMRIIELPGDQR